MGGPPNLEGRVVDPLGGRTQAVSGQVNELQQDSSTNEKSIRKGRLLQVLRGDGSLHDGANAKGKRIERSSSQMHRYFVLGLVALWQTAI